MASKIVVIGSVNGQLESIFSRLAKLHAKTSFSFLLVVGDLFAPPDGASDDEIKELDSLLNETLVVPLPTYFTLGLHALPERVIDRIEANDGEICTNLYYLNKRSTTKTSEGIRIVALGGSLDAHVAVGESADRFLPFHTESDARTLRGANHADILLTMHWPTSILNGSNVSFADGMTPPRSEQCIADLSSALRPRYHFSTSPEAFWEREPFVHPTTEDSPDARPVTRFISLASSTATSKAKWLYAFTLDPQTANKAPPTGTTASPFVAAPGRKRSHASSNQPPPSTGMRNLKRRKKPQPPPGPNECFFCLANPNLSTHILTSIGDHSYLSTARGPLLKTSTFPDLSFQSHTLIIPLAHAATLSAISEKNEADATFAEMSRYRHVLQSMIATKSRRQLGTVTWELSRNTGVHVHWQLLPIPRKLVDDGLVEAAFRVQAENAQYPTLERREIGNRSDEGDYFRIWLWKPTVDDQGAADEKDHGVEPTAEISGEEIQLVMSLNDVNRFDVAFGRRVMAQLLELEGRTDWKNCVQSEEEETVEAEGFKDAFKAWDFAQ